MVTDEITQELKILSFIFDSGGVLRKNDWKTALNYAAETADKFLKKHRLPVKFPKFDFDPNVHWAKQQWMLYEKFEGSDRKKIENRKQELSAAFELKFLIVCLESLMSKTRKVGNNSTVLSPKELEMMLLILFRIGQLTHALFLQLQIGENVEVNRRSQNAMHKNNKSLEATQNELELLESGFIRLLSDPSLLKDNGNLNKALAWIIQDKHGKKFIPKKNGASTPEELTRRRYRRIVENERYATRFSEILSQFKKHRGA